MNTGSSTVAIAPSDSAYVALISAWTVLRSVLVRAGCRKSDEEVEANLLWIGDLSPWVSPEEQPALCEAWHVFWTALWQYRNICPHTEWVVKPYIQHLPNHQVCASCSRVRVLNPAATVVSESQEYPAEIRDLRI